MSKRNNCIVIDIHGNYDAKSIFAFMSAETTISGVRLTVGGPIADAILALSNGTFVLTPVPLSEAAGRAALKEG